GAWATGGRCRRPRRARASGWRSLSTSDFRSPIDLRRIPLDDPGHDVNLRPGLGPVPFLDRFPHTGERLHAVSGVEAGSVNLMAEPWPSRQPFRPGESLLDMHQD